MQLVKARQADGACTPLAPVDTQQESCPFVSVLIAEVNLCPATQLVRARQAEGAYTPLTPGDVAAATMPPVREPDAYLKSRLDQFYAELQVSCQLRYSWSGLLRASF